ncbi:MAG TPA: glycosyltransferase [Gemmatimonadaceae bacterium]|nr:glycosyltransferase [Gemmatimonadaceae bacterium]
MRVLFVTHNYPRFPGDAAGSFLHTLAVALRGADVEVRVVAPADRGEASRAELDGIAVQRVRYAPAAWETLAYTGTMAAQVQRGWSARAAMAGMLVALARAGDLQARRWRADVLHAHWWFPAGLALSMPLVGGRRPLMITMHGSDVRLATGTSWAPALMRRVVARAARTVTVSGFLADRVARTGAPRPLVIPMPVRAELFPPRSESDWRQVVPGRVLFVGRPSAQKGLRDLLGAIRHLPHSTLDVAGDGPERATLEAYAREIGVADRVRWLGHLPQPELGAHYRAASAVAIPSRDEGLGLVAVEAQLSEAPVVAWDSGGLRDVVEHGVTGWLVPPDDETALAKRLEDVLFDPDAARRMAGVARRSALKRFGAEAVAARYAELYGDVASGKRTSGEGEGEA